MFILNRLFKHWKSENIPLIFLCLVVLGYVMKGPLPKFLDVTLISYIILYCLAIYKLFFLKQPLSIFKIDSIAYIWAITLLLSIIYSPYTSAAIFKVAKFIFLGLSLYFFPRFFIKKRTQFLVFFKYLLILATFIELIVIVDFIVKGAPLGRYTAFDTVHPIPLTMVGATTSLTALLLLLYKQVGFYYISLCLVPSLAIIIIGSSKGPLISFFITLIIFMPALSKKLKLKHIITILVLIYITIHFDFLNKNLDYYIFRFNNLSEDQSSLERIFLYKHALNLFINSPFWGVGVSGISSDYYPHNIILEILAENGLILFFLFLLVIIMLIFSYIKFITILRHDCVTAIVLAILTISIISLQFSWTYVDHKYLYLGLGLLITNFKLLKDEKIER